MMRGSPGMQLAGPGGPAAADGVDAGLWTRVQHGDEQALGALYDRWVHQVYSVASSLLGDPGEVDAAVEQTFRMVWREAQRHDPFGTSVGTRIILMARAASLSR